VDIPYRESVQIKQEDGIFHHNLTWLLRKNLRLYVSLVLLLFLFLKKVILLLDFLPKKSLSLKIFGIHLEVEDVLEDVLEDGTQTVI
jgi:hypothetical protein